MEEIAPSKLVERWDNSGLQVGKRDWPVRKVVTALDPCPIVIQEAIEQKADLLITHHPLIFTPLKAIDLDSPVGEIIGAALTNHLAIYCAHTNLDSAVDGLNDILALRIGLTHISVLQPALNSDAAPFGHSPQPCEGIGRLGTLLRPACLKDLAIHIKNCLSLDRITMVGNPEMTVHQIAVCTGSGSGLLDTFYASGAQVYVSGDFRYHDARNAEMNQVGLIDVGHFSSEHLMAEALASRLQQVFDARGETVRIHASPIEKNPFVIL